MNPQEYNAKASKLRHDPMVEAWIAAYQADQVTPHEDCKHCGFPHDKHLLCGGTFGKLVFGGNAYYIDRSSLIYWRGFVDDYAPQGAFHWKHERFFRRTDAGVEVTFFAPYNNCPQKVVWLIPENEWASICSAVAVASGVQPSDGGQQK